MENRLNRFVAQYFGNTRSSLHSVPGTGKSLYINGGDRGKAFGDKRGRDNRSRLSRGKRDRLLRLGTIELR